MSVNRLIFKKIDLAMTVAPFIDFRHHCLNPIVLFWLVLDAILWDTVLLDSRGAIRWLFAILIINFNNVIIYIQIIPIIINTIDF